MAICQLMISDFMHGTGRFDPETGERFYSEANLLEGVEYADWLIADGLRREPFHHYDLQAFRQWALVRLCEMTPFRLS